MRFYVHDDVPGDEQLVALHLHGGLFLQGVSSLMDVVHAQFRFTEELPCEIKNTAFLEFLFYFTIFPTGALIKAPQRTVFSCFSLIWPRFKES